jgi:hypothetical protein
MRGCVVVEPPSRAVQLGARTEKAIDLHVDQVNNCWKKVDRTGKEENRKHRRYERTRRTEISTGNN